MHFSIQIVFEEEELLVMPYSAVHQRVFFKEENMLIIHFPLPDSCRFETTGFKACVSNLHASTTFLDAPSLCLTLNRPRKLIYWCSVHPLAPLGLREGGGSETVERLSRVKSDFFQHMWPPPPRWGCLFFLEHSRPSGVSPKMFSPRHSKAKSVNLQRWFCARASLVVLVSYKIF